jgi:CHAT domain-containing protein
LLTEPLGLPARIRRVLVSPTGVLGHVPFPQLFGEREVCLVPSGTVWLALREASVAGGGTGVLALGDPDYRTGPRGAVPAGLRGGLALDPLPGTRTEAESVGDVVLLGSDATEEGLRRALARRARWRAIHLACHGLVDPEPPLQSSLALTPADADDGFLTQVDVLRLRATADLVVLSACESGKGSVRRGEGAVGLARAFLLAGSPRVLVSLWKVDDRATRLLMEAFYALWKGTGMPPAAALRRAQIAVRDHEARVIDPVASRAAGRDVVTVRRPFAEPRFWAAWVLWGLPD